MKKQQERILIVDDFKASALFVQSILEAKGYKVFLAHTGPTALDFVENNPIDLMLLDIIIPEIDGYEVCRRIRRKAKHEDMPIIFMTSKDDESSIELGFNVGAQDYLKKPFLRQELLARVRTQLTVKRQRTQLEAINKRLEKRVSEKTHKLDEAFIELQKAYKDLEDANKKLEVLDQAKVNFLLIISHEIRTPLNSILGFSEILKGFEGSKEYEESVNMLFNSARRLEDFAQNAILISELQLSKYIFQNKQNNLQKLIAIVLENLKSLYSSKHPTITFDFSNELRVYGDEYLLSTCFFNILDNAFRYVNEEGNIEISAWDEDQEIVVEIKDEGKHFSDATLADPFSLFTKGEKFINNNPGNGLSIIKYIMDSSNGRIELFNTSEGACIKLFFPHYRE